MPVEIDSKAFTAGLLAAAARLEASAEAETQRVGSLVERSARQKAPKLTGTLAASIGSHRIRDGVEITVDADYGGYVEYGTSDTPSQPFLRPALNEAASEFGRGIRL